MDSLILSFLHALFLPLKKGRQGMITQRLRKESKTVLHKVKRKLLVLIEGR